MMSRSLRLMLLGGAAMVATGTAHAQSGSTATAAGTEVSNTATVTYTVNGASQTTTSNTAKFVVDRKVDFTVITDQTGATQVNLSQQAAVTKFKVTNHTNGIQDFWLDPDQTTLSVGILTGTDDFDISSMKVFVDSNGNGVYDAEAAINSLQGLTTLPTTWTATITDTSGNVLGSAHMVLNGTTATATLTTASTANAPTTPVNVTTSTSSQHHW